MTEGEPINVVETTTIKAKFARMPIQDLSVRFLVQELEPVPMVARIETVTHNATMSSGKKDIDLLKEQLLKVWHDQINEHTTSEDREKLPDWMKEVDNVELIECDLLVPKDNSQPVTGPGKL